MFGFRVEETSNPQKHSLWHMRACFYRRDDAEINAQAWAESGQHTTRILEISGDVYRRYWRGEDERLWLQQDDDTPICLHDPKNPTDPRNILARIMAAR